MAFNSDMVFEVRTAGHADNGGGFRASASGTDYSQQDAPEISVADLEIHASVNTRIRSASRAPVNADTGNILNVTAGTGFTVQRLEITGNTGGYWTVDKSAGTLSSTGGSGRLGGAITSIQTALTNMTTAGMTAYVRAGSGYTLGSSQLASVANGATNAPMKLVGYTTTRGDNGQVTITAGDTTPTRVIFVNHTFWHVRNFIVDCADIVETGIEMGAASGLVENCTARQWLNRGIYLAARGNSARDCWATDGTGGSGLAAALRAGFAWGADGCQFIRCATTDSLSNGFMGATGTVADLHDCVAYSLSLETAAGGHGVTGLGTASARVVNGTFASLAGSGIYAQATNGMNEMHVENCIFSDIARYAFASGSTSYLLATSGFARRMRNNAFYSVTLGRQDINFPAGIDEITLTASPFVDLAAGDLDLNNAAGGGALLREAGIPGSFLGLPLAGGATDVGALQATVASNDATEGGLIAMVDLFREWTSEFSTTRLPDTAVHKYLQSGLVELNRILAYSFADDTIPLVAGTQEYDQPAGAMELVFVEHDGKRLEKADLEEWERTGKEWRTLPASTPKFWAHYGDQVVLIPKPDAAAVAVASTATVRYLRSPRDIGVYGPEGLVESDYRTAVRWAVREFSAAHPDSATAQMRAAQFEQMFNAAAAGAVEFYTRRRLSRGAAGEMLLASGPKRGKV